MPVNTHIKDSVRVKHAVSVVIMCACMWFLTGINFILFPVDKDQTVRNYACNDCDPQGPVEEKSPEKTNLTSIQEEYIHEHSSVELTCYNNVTLHKIHRSEKLQIVYAEIIIPPPKF